jgi:carbon-monoxide dehydrogenase small subunit
MSRHNIVLTVNGKRRSIEVESHRSLLDVIREDLELTGTKRGCDNGDCGACTVLLNGKPVNACLVLAVQADGQDVATIEGVALDDELHPIQEAFIEHGAVQCGFCTPAMIMTAKVLIEETPQPTREEIKKAISGTLCRCTGYVQIIDAIQSCGQSSK